MSPVIVTWLAWVDQSVRLSDSISHVSRRVVVHSVIDLEISVEVSLVPGHGILGRCFRHLLGFKHTFKGNVVLSFISKRV